MKSVYSVPPLKKRDIFEVFWDNVEWHAQKQGISYTSLFGGNAPLARKRQYNLTLRKIELVAERLGIEDYSILFENYEV